MGLTRVCRDELADALDPPFLEIEVCWRLPLIPLLTPDPRINLGVDSHASRDRWLCAAHHAGGQYITERIGSESRLRKAGMTPSDSAPLMIQVRG